MKLREFDATEVQVARLATTHAVLLLTAEVMLVDVPVTVLVVAPPAPECNV